MTVLILILCKLLYTRKEAAEMLGIGIRKLDEFVMRGEIKPRRIDNAVRFYIGELVQFASMNSGEIMNGDNASEVTNDHAA